MLSTDYQPDKLYGHLRDEALCVPARRLLDWGDLCGKWIAPFHGLGFWTKEKNSAKHGVRLCLLTADCV